MRVNTLSLKNFRCFDEREFSFSPGFNVCIGENGSGKTALLDALSIAVGSFLMGIVKSSGRLPIEQDVRSVTIRHGETVTRERVKPLVIRCSGTFSRLGNFLVRQAGGSARVSEFETWWWRSLRGQRTTRKGAVSIKQIAEIVRKRVVAGEAVTLPLIAFHGTGRLWWNLRDRHGEVEPTGPTSRFSGYENCLEPASDHKGFARWMKRLELRQLQEGVTIAELEIVRGVAREAIPGCKDLRYLVNDDELIATMHSGTLVPVSSLSDGQRTVLGLVTDLARRCAVLNPHLGLDAARRTHGVVLIDELDLHLHPTWQRRIVDDLRRLFPELQFIATTHSPFIVQSLRADELIDLDRRGGEHVNQSVEDIAEDVMGVEHPQRSRHFLAMMDAADAYYRALDEAASAPDDATLDALKSTLDELAARYPTEPAYAAFLRQKRIARRLPGDAEG